MVIPKIFNPIFSKRTGSVTIIVPNKFIKIVECPIHEIFISLFFHPAGSGLVPIITISLAFFFPYFNKGRNRNDPRVNLRLLNKKNFLLILIIIILGELCTPPFLRRQVESNLIR